MYYFVHSLSLICHTISSSLFIFSNLSYIMLIFIYHCVNLTLGISDWMVWKGANLISNFGVKR